MNLDIANMVIDIGQNANLFDKIVDIATVFSGTGSLIAACVSIWYTKKSITDQNNNFRAQIQIQEQQWLNSSFINQRNIELINLKKHFSKYILEISKFNNLLFGIPTSSILIDGDKTLKPYYKDIIGNPRDFLSKFVNKSVEFKEFLENIDFILPITCFSLKKIVALNNLYFNFFQNFISNENLKIFDNSFTLIETNYSFDKSKYIVSNNTELKFLFIKTFTQFLPVYYKNEKGDKCYMSILERYNFIGDKTCSEDNFKLIAQDDNLFFSYLQCFNSYILNCQQEIQLEIEKCMDKSILKSFYKEGRDDL